LNRSVILNRSGVVDVADGSRGA